MYKLTRNLVKKSNDAFLLSLELFNKPTITYRAESFSLFFSNAWELLLKAHIYEQNKGKRLSIFHRKIRNQKRRSISIDECLNKVFLDQNDPVRRNVEYISEIRNEASHLIISELDPYFSRAFQAGVINYVDHLCKWFGININDRLNPGLISLISDKDRTIDLDILKRKFNREDFESIIHWVKKFEELDKLGEKATISINHTIAIIKKPDKADFIISSAQKGQRGAIVIDRLREPDVIYPYNRKAAMEQVKQRIPKEIYFNNFDFDSYVFVKGFKKHAGEYYYKGKFSGSAQYSQKFIDEFIEAIGKNRKSLIQWRSKYKQYLRNKRKVL